MKISRTASFPTLHAPLPITQNSNLSRMLSLVVILYNTVGVIYFLITEKPLIILLRLQTKQLPFMPAYNITNSGIFLQRNCNQSAKIVIENAFFKGTTTKALAGHRTPNLGATSTSIRGGLSLHLKIKIQQFLFGRNVQQKFLYYCRSVSYLQMVNGHNFTHFFAVSLKMLESSREQDVSSSGHCSRCSIVCVSVPS